MDLQKPFRPAQIRNWVLGMLAVLLCAALFIGCEVNHPTVAVAERSQVLVKTASTYWWKVHTPPVRFGFEALQILYEMWWNLLLFDGEPADEQRLASLATKQYDMLGEFGFIAERDLAICAALQDIMNIEADCAAD